MQSCAGSVLTEVSYENHLGEMFLLLHFGIQRALKIGGDAAEFTHGLAEGAGNTCQTLGPQHHKGHKKDNQKFRTADTEHIFLCC